jgi:hypothetical protein
MTVVVDGEKGVRPVKTGGDVHTRNEVCRPGLDEPLSRLRDGDDGDTRREMCDHDDVGRSDE